MGFSRLCKKKKIQSYDRDLLDFGKFAYRDAGETRLFSLTEWLAALGLSGIFFKPKSRCQACQRYWNSSIEWKAINRKRRLSLWLSKWSLRNFSFDNIFFHVVTERWKTSGELFSSRRRSRIFIRVSVSTEVVKLMYVSCYTNCKHVMRVTYLFIGNCVSYPRRERLEIWFSCRYYIKYDFHVWN